MSRSRRKKKYQGTPCRCWLCSPSDRVRHHQACKRRVEIREGLHGERAAEKQADRERDWADIW